MPRGTRRRWSASIPGRIDAARMNAKNSSAITSFSFQRASAVTTIPPMTSVATAARIAEKVRKREGLTIRCVKMKDFAAEVDRIKQVYNSAWEKNWGFVPLTDREFDRL